jgi:hypothetical protein
VWFKGRQTAVIFLENLVVMFSAPRFDNQIFRQPDNIVCIETTCDSFYYLATDKLRLKMIDVNSDKTLREFTFDQDYRDISAVSLTTPNDLYRKNLLALSKGNSIKLFDMAIRSHRIGESEQHWRFHHYTRTRFFGDHGLASLDSSGKIMLWDLRALKKPAGIVEKPDRVVQFDVNPKDTSLFAYVTEDQEINVYNVQTSESTLGSQIESSIAEITWRHDGVISLIQKYPKPGVSSWEMSSKKSLVRKERLLEDFPFPGADIQTASFSRDQPLAITLGSFNYIDPTDVDQQHSSNVSILRL